MGGDSVAVSVGVTVSVSEMFASTTVSFVGVPNAPGGSSTGDVGVDSPSRVHPASGTAPNAMRARRRLRVTIL
jgi:hypothetical protein